MSYIHPAGRLVRGWRNFPDLEVDEEAVVTMSLLQAERVRNCTYSIAEAAKIMKVNKCSLTRATQKHMIPFIEIPLAKPMRGYSTEKRLDKGWVHKQAKRLKSIKRSTKGAVLFPESDQRITRNFRAHYRKS